jgi:hypothetical protein
MNTVHHQNRFNLRLSVQLVLLWVCTAVLLFTACESKPKKLSQDELTKYIQNRDNGLIKKRESKGVVTTVTYKPKGLLVLQELSASDNKDSISIPSLEKKYGSAYYFTLNFSKNNKEAIREMGGFSGYSNMLQTLAFHMQEYVTLTTSLKDTIPLASFYFDQTNGLSQSSSVLLAFLNEKANKAEVVDINVSECGFGTGNLKFSFRRQDLEAVPALDYSDTRH